MPTTSPISDGTARVPSNVHHAGGRFCQLSVRMLLVVLGGAAVAWGAYVLPVFARQAPLEHLAAHVIAGDPFKPEALAAFMPQLEAAEQATECRAPALHSAAMIRTRVTEQALADANDFGAQLTALRASIYKSLACSPTDSFLWLALYWVESNRSGFQPAYIDYLRLSYQSGPNEGWIALKRSPYALAVFDRLPPDLQEMVVAEFANLLNSSFVTMAVQIIEGPGWSHRGVLLSHLTNVTARYRDEFARELYRDGYDVTVPGIAPRDPRPWD
jgi:hypothetical protein